MSSEQIEAVIFPGQGSSFQDSLIQLKQLNSFDQRLAEFERLTDINLLREISINPDINHENIISSLLVTLASVVCWDSFQQQYSANPKSFLFAGYSVGQWMALYASGRLNLSELIQVIKYRCELMDALSSRRPTSMIAVVGLEERIVQDVIQELSCDETMAVIANYNSFRSFSISLDSALVTPLISAFEKLNATFVKKLPVSGGWHSLFMEPAISKLHSFLQENELSFEGAKVLDNVTGKIFPTEKNKAQETASLHIARPVRWFDCIKKIESMGIKSIHEVGCGRVLSNIGFFISRDLKFIPFL